LSQFLHFGGKHPSGIRQGDIIGYRHHLEMRNMSSSTIVQHLASISGYYELCRRRGLAADNPANGVERPYVSAYTGATWLSLDKAKLLLAQPDRSTVKGKRDYAILIAISLTSMRCAELCSLKIRDVIHSGERIRLRYIGKGGGDVVREIPSGCWQVIEEYLSASGRHLIRESPVFAAVASGSKKRRAEKPLTTEAVRQMVAGYVREAFGSDVRITPHSLRHTAATLLRANGRELGEIQSFLRHKRAETTRQYLHILETSDAEISESLWEKLTG